MPRSTPSIRTTWPAQRRRAATSSLRCWPRPRHPVPTCCTPWDTRTSTRRGCGRPRDRAQGLAHLQQRAVAHGRDPAFVFASSSAQQFAWMKEHYPALWERLKERVAEGRFVPVGGMWVESDTNMVGGEAMARQFVEGKSFFLEEFGIDTEEVWLPTRSATAGPAADHEGRRCALVPHAEDLVERDQPHPAPHLPLGGHRRLAHLHALPAGRQVQLRGDRGRPRARRAQLRRQGPRAHLAAAVRLRRRRRRTHARDDRDHRARPLARGRADREALDPAGVLRDRRGRIRRPGRVGGELYLEFHRGTYTSQLRTKQGNRRSEHLLREAELWAATATVRTGAEYPAEAFRRLWRLVLLQQFHDILPGTSIAWVHRDAERNYAAIAAELEQIIADSLRALAGEGDRTLLANAAPHARSGRPPWASRRRRGRATSRRAPRARATCSTTASCTRSSTVAGSSSRSSTSCRAARSCPRGRWRGCSRCSATPRPSGTRGTSTRPTAVTPHPSTAPTPSASTATPSWWNARSATPRSSRASRSPRGRARCACRSTSTGTSSRSCSSSASRSTCTPTVRHPRSSSVTSCAPPTRTPRGTRRVSRPPRTGGCGSPSPTSASP